MMGQQYEGLKQAAQEGLIKGTGFDPWANRSSGMRCSTCVWFVPKFSNATVQPQDHKVVGRCRRHAPTMSGYPVVYLDDWCGDHRIDETKV